MFAAVLTAIVVEVMAVNNRSDFDNSDVLVDRDHS